MRTIEAGSEAIAAVLKLKYNSRNKFSLFFWDDAACTIPSNLSSTVITLEIDDPSAAAPTVWTATISTNQATFDQAAASVQYTWDVKRFRVVLTKSGARDIAITGEARIQR